MPRSLFASCTHHSQILGYQFRLNYGTIEGMVTAEHLNVNGGSLAKCSEAGMARTGYARTGSCEDATGDIGSHHVCIDRTSLLLFFVPRPVQRILLCCPFSVDLAHFSSQHVSLCLTASFPASIRSQWRRRREGTSVRRRGNPIGVTRSCHAMMLEEEMHYTRIVKFNTGTCIW